MRVYYVYHSSLFQGTVEAFSYSKAQSKAERKYGRNVSVYRYRIR